jgi:two-component system NtrC family sensor kinase
MDANPAAARILGQDLDDLVGVFFDEFLPDSSDRANMLETPDTDSLGHSGEMLHKDGHHIPVLHSVNHIEGSDAGVILFGFQDITARKQAEDKLKESNEKLRSTLNELQEHKNRIVQSEKMASIGQLAAGVAHEINNPIGFVTSNLGTLNEYTETMKNLLALHDERAALPLDQEDRRKELADQIKEMREEEDLEFILDDLENVMKETMEGLVRVSEIVQNLKSFAREDSSGHSRHDVNAGIEAVLKVVWNELKYRCQVEMDLGEIPPVLGHGGKINQVVMNMMVNGSHAMPQEGGLLKVSTEQVGEDVVITVSDNGCGMDEETMSRIFDPFFTTKDVGSGTGLGLSISHGIVEDHKGRIEVESEVGVGTTFRIILPIGKEPEVDLSTEAETHPDDQLIG